MEVNFKVSLDDKELQKQLQEDVAKKAKGTIRQQLDDFFNEKTHHRPQGIGHRDIESKLVEIWESPQFQERIDKLFEDEWETIFRAALVKAATHKANGIAFNRVKHASSTDKDVFTEQQVEAAISALMTCGGVYEIEYDEVREALRRMKVTP